MGQYWFVVYVEWVATWDDGTSDTFTHHSDIPVSATPAAPPPSDNNNPGPSGGSGSGTTNPTPPPEEKTDTTIFGGTGRTATVDIPATVNKDTGEVTVKLDKKTTDTLIADAIAKAEGHNNQPTVTLNLTGVENATKAVLNMDAVQTFDKSEVAVTIKLPDTEITITPDALATLAAVTHTGETPVTIEAAVVPMTTLQGMQAAQIRDYETVVSIDVFVGGNKVNVPLTIRLPYTLNPGEDSGAVCVWYMDDSGNLPCQLSQTPRR